MSVVYALEQLHVWKEIIWVTHFQTLTHAFGFKFDMYFLKKAIDVNSLLLHYPAHLNPVFYWFLFHLVYNVDTGEEVLFICLFVT